jgi:prevent-host-death family protein
MITVSIVELKAKASELVHRAEKGERVIITRNGKSVAELSSTDMIADDLADKAAWIRERIGKHATVNPPVTLEEIHEWIHEGRR